MRKKCLPISAAIAAIIFLCVFGRPFEENAQAAPSMVTITEDQATGHITVENDAIKGIWHYKNLASENYCQSGGNLFQLYYKPTDPETINNLVSYAPDQLQNWGTERATGRWYGVGGIGATDIYAADQPPADSSTNNFSDNFADNNVSGILESHSSYTDAQGNAFLIFSYRIRDNDHNKDWYRVEKAWMVGLDGTINLDVEWTLLRSGYFSEPTVHNRWSNHMRWDRWVKYGTDWSNSSDDKYLLGMSGLADNYLPADGSQTFNAFTDMNAFSVDWMAFVGSDIAPNIVVNNQMGGSVGAFSRTALEQNIGQLTAGSTDEIIGGYGAVWMSWWGGKPPKGSRYQWLPQGTSWHHAFQIELMTDFPGDGPDISSIKTTRVGSNSLEVSWKTNTPSDSSVEIETASGNWHQIGTDPGMTQSHAVLISDPGDGLNYFRVTSRDTADHVAVSGGYQLNPEINAYPFNLTLATNNVVWASYRDYLDHKLSAEFEIHNSGPGDVESMTINNIRTESNVVALNTMPKELGGIAAGSSVYFSAAYRVPAGVTYFTTFIDGSATDMDGASFEFPQQINFSP